MVKKWILLLISVITLVACNSTTIEEKMYGYLEEAVKLEEDFSDQQKNITKLEAEEQEIYNEIIDLGMEDFKKIEQLSQTAIENINERTELIELEKEIIGSSQTEFLKTEDLIEKIKEQDLKKKSEDMFEKMNNRYEAYYKLNEAYMTSLNLEAELYEMLQTEELKQEDLTRHIEKINKSYEKVLEANQKFNELTLEYNDLKKEFYRQAGFDVA